MAGVGDEKPRRRWPRRTLWAGSVSLGLAAALAGSGVAWTYVASAGHRYDATDAPDAPVAIVFGAQIETPYLSGRLDTTVELVESGKVRSVLVSGNAAGTSGDETKAMTSYLSARGVPAAKIVVDEYGLDTYDTCARAVQVYGVRRALLVTQSYHLPRAVALCRSLGVDADGVKAACDCGRLNLLKNQAREWFATVLALKNAIWHRPPAVVSPPDDSLRAITPR